MSESANINRLLTWMILGCFASLVPAVQGQLKLAGEREPQRLFVGKERTLAVTWQNMGSEPIAADLRVRLLQTSSATAILLNEVPWKTLRVLPGQTILETARLDFPAVKAETRFLVQWFEGTNRVFGTTEVLVYPTNLLNELGSLVGEATLGVFDPRNELKPLLKSAGVEFADLQDAGVESYPGKLAIVGPFESKAQMREDLPSLIETIARKGVAVVWIQPPPETRPPTAPREAIKPSFYTVPIGKGAVVVVQAGLVSDLARRPKAQLNLIHLARLALHPEPLRLPNSTAEP